MGMYDEVSNEWRIERKEMQGEPEILYSILPRDEKDMVVRKVPSKNDPYPPLRSNGWLYGKYRNVMPPAEDIFHLTEGETLTETVKVPRAKVNSSAGWGDDIFLSQQDVFNDPLDLGIC